MNPFELDATGLMLWGLVAHLIADWPLQNDWMSAHKAERWRSGRALRRWRAAHPQSGVGWVGENAEFPYRGPARWWWSRHPAAYVHAGIHGVLLAFVFGWIAVPLAVAHLLIDCRWIVARWSRLVRQTQPNDIPVRVETRTGAKPSGIELVVTPQPYDVGIEVRIWTDQAAHVATIAVAALLVGVA